MSAETKKTYVSARQQKARISLAQRAEHAQLNQKLCCTWTAAVVCQKLYLDCSNGMPEAVLGLCQWYAHLVLAQEHFCKTADSQAPANQHLARVKLPLTPVHSSTTTADRTDTGKNCKKRFTCAKSNSMLAAGICVFRLASKQLISAASTRGTFTFSMNGKEIPLRPSYTLCPIAGIQCYLGWKPSAGCLRTAGDLPCRCATKPG